jgi:hypothetical protein
MHAIRALVARDYGIDVEELLSQRGKARLAEPRQLAIYLCWVCTQKSSLQIGSVFRRDHSTVLHAIARTEQRMRQDPEFAARARRLQAECAALEPGHQFGLEDVVEEFRRLLASLLRRDPRLLLATLRELAERRP